MRKAIKIIGVLFILVSLASSYTFKETISLTGNGKLFAETHTKQSGDLVDGNKAGDLVQGSGKQYYYRELISEPNQFELTSNYDLKSDGANKIYYNMEFPKDENGYHKNISIFYPTNRYSISMASPSGLQHVVSVRGFSGTDIPNLTSKSSIIFTMPTFAKSSVKFGAATNYNVEGAGELSETMSDSSAGLHPRSVAETSISSSHFTLSSGISTNQAVEGSDISSPALYSGNAINLTTEHGAPNLPPRISDFLALIDSSFQNSLINKTDYLDQLKKLLTDQDVTSTIYLEELKSMLDNGKINQKDYDGAKNAAFVTEISLNDVNRILNNLEDAFDKGNKTKDQYISDLHQLWNENKINGTTYLSILKSRTMSGIGNITAQDYNNAKKEVFLKEGP